MIRLVRGARGAAMVALVCASCGAARAEPAALQGRIASGGGFLGDWDFYPSACAVHGDEVVLLESKNSPKTVRIVDRSRAPSTRNAKIDVHVAKATPTGSMDLLFTDPSCVKSSLQSSPQGYAGEVSLDCKTGEGGHVIGTITFDRCR